MRCLLASLFSILLCSVTACTSGSPSSSPEIGAKQAPFVMSDKVLASASGVNVGPLMAAHTVYVFFDMQCPHCGHLWNAAKDLEGTVKFVWIPVGLLTPASTAQGALLLSSVKGSDVLEKHEALLLAHKGGITVLGVAATPGAGEKVAENTRILKMMGSTSVPFLVSKRANGTFGTATGALSSSQLREFIAQ